MATSTAEAAVAGGPVLQATAAAASLSQAGDAFFEEVDFLCSGASEFLAELAKQAAEADRQQLRTAALKLRLSQLAGERRRREAEDAAALAARQRELDRLLQAEQALAAQAQPASTAASPVSRSN